MRYEIIVWNDKVAYTLTETFWSDKSAIDFAKTRAHSDNNVRLYSCKEKRDIYVHHAQVQTT